MSWPGMIYADPADVLAVAADARPPRMPVPTGNGRRVPTRYRVRLATSTGRRWRRVYVMTYGTPGTPYVIADGRRVALDTGRVCGQ